MWRVLPSKSLICAISFSDSRISFYKPLSIWCWWFWTLLEYYCGKNNNMKVHPSKCLIYMFFFLLVSLYWAMYGGWFRTYTIISLVFASQNHHIYYYISESRKMPKFWDRSRGRMSRFFDISRNLNMDISWNKVPVLSLLLRHDGNLHCI